jgi:superfamily II DNA/RNA helicase
MTSSFRAFALRDEIARALDEAGYHTPTPIQAQAIPVVLRGHDLVGIAQTGTGKTLAYFIPILQAYRPSPDGPQAVVVCPTRELAIQVAGEAERFGKHLGIRTVLAYGGTSSGHQKQELHQGCDLLVATPGRLLDFLNQAWVSLRRVRFLVLDEADRMLDMGFINDVDAIVRKAPMSRQTLLFSATFPDEIKQLADRYLMHPETVRIDAVIRVKESVEHAFIEVAGRRKVDALLALLDRDRPAKCLVFTATREMTSELTRRLRTRNHEVVSLSSLLSQANRERALTAFRTGVFDVLVATDVAARGLDIDDIDLVVNFDVPMHPEEYVHRIGRTGRAHRTGKALTFVSELDVRRARQIEELLGHPVPRETVAGFEAGPPAPDARRGAGGSRRRPRARVGAGEAGDARRSRGPRRRGRGTP